jgi:2-polyprenyl-3-methyl-5-hydroxy-6-metoxy-1,4-benzoquinol methylase
MKCCICDNSDTSPYFTVGSHVFEQCAHCGLVFVTNFTQEDISYKGDEYFVQKNEYVQRWDEFCFLFEHLVAKVMRFKQTGNFLDVGGGVGTLMHVVKKYGFTVYGVEVSEWASAYARNERGLNMVTGMLEDAGHPDAFFDVIVINHVLEHVTAPIKLLGEAHRILKDDGVLVVGVPNIGSIMARIMGERWLSLRPEEHIWHFTPNTLRRLMERAGFREIWFEARDNYSVQGWSPKEIAQRIINGVSVITNRSEAMLIFAGKK